MSCHSTTRAQEDPYAFTESAPLQANSLAYANHSSAVSNSTNSSNSNATTSTTIQTASSGASLLLTTNAAGSGTTSKDKVVTITPPAALSPATLKVRYNGVVTTASPTTTAVVRGPATGGTPIPVFTKPVQIRQQSPQSALQAQPQPTVTVGKLIKKVLPQQKTPMITTVVAGGAKIISRLQPSNQSSSGGPQLATTGGSILKFIKIPPQQLAKGTAGGGTIPQGSFIHVTTSGDGARKLIVTNSSSNGVTPTISVATTSSARIANVGTAVNRNTAGVAVVSNVSTVSPTKIRLVQPQAQGKFYLQTTANSSTIGTATHLSNPVTIATLRNTLIKQHQLQQQQQSPLQQQKQQPVHQQQQTVQQKVLPSQQQQASPTTKPQPITSQALPPQQKQPQQQIQQQQHTHKQQKSQQLKQQQVVSIQSPQSLSHMLPITSPQHQVPKTSAPLLQSQALQKLDSPETTQKLQQKQQIQTGAVQQQQQLVSKALLQSAPNGQKQSLLLQQQQQQSSKQAPSPTVQSAAPKLQSVQQPQSLLLQPQRKQQQSYALAVNKQRAVPQQQPPKPTTSIGSVSLLTSSAITAKDGSLQAKINDTTKVSTVSPKEEKPCKPVESVRRSVNQQSLLVAANVEASTKSPQPRDQSPVVNRVEKINRSSSVTVESKVFSAVAKKRSEIDAVSGPVNIGGTKVNEIKATEQPTTLDIKPTLKMEEPMLPDNMNGKVRQMSGRKSAMTGKTPGKQQKSSKRTHSQHLLEEQEQLRDCTSPVVGAAVMTKIGSSPSCTTSTPNAPTRINLGGSYTPSLLTTVKLENEFEIKQEAVELDEKPPRQQRFVASSTVPGATAVPIKRPKLREWHAPGAYMFDLKDPGDESDDDAYDEYPNTLSFWYEESIAITVPESTSSWAINPIHRSSSSSSSSVRGGKNKANRGANSAKFEIRMLTRDERLELKKAYLQRRVVQCRNGLRMKSATASIAKKRLESMARMVAKVDKRRQTELNKASEKATCTYEGCTKSALVMTSHCYDHVTEEAQQCLFQRCTAKFSDNSQCRVPVFDVSHELILCKEHAWKHDNHDKMSQEVKLHKKPATTVAAVNVPASPTIAGRKKAKPPQPPPVVVRSQKRPKKKKKLTPLQQQMLLHQQQYKQQFSMHHTHQSNQSNQQQAKPATPASNPPQKKVMQQQQQQPQKSLLNTWSVNGKVQLQVKQATPLQKPSLIAHPGQRLHLINGSESPLNPTFNVGVPRTAAQVNRNLLIPAAVGNNRSVAGARVSTVFRGKPNNSTVEIVDSLEHDQAEQQKLKQHQQQHQYSNGSHAVQTTLNNASPNTQDLLTICENSSAYASSEDTGVGGLSESELLATQDVIEEIIPFEFSNLLHPNVLSHLPTDALNELLCLGDVPAEDETGDSHESCPREVEDDIERALEHVKSLDDMTVEPSSLLGDFLDNVDDEMLDGSDICNTEQMLQSPNKTGDIRGMVHT